MKKTILILIVTTLTSLSHIHAQEPFWLGADISGTTELEARGVRLYNAKGDIRENTALMKELGLNAIRLRVWVNPSGGFCSKDDVLTMAKRAQYYGMAVMIDFHYSDWWADPGKQHIPASWQYFKYDEMLYALAEHTRETLQLLKDNHIDVRWVQVGNETTHGMLWPMGKAEDNMQQYAGLTEAGYFILLLEIYGGKFIESCYRDGKTGYLRWPTPIWCPLGHDWHECLSLLGQGLRAHLLISGDHQQGGGQHKSPQPQIRLRAYDSRDGCRGEEAQGGQSHHAGSHQGRQDPMRRPLQRRVLLGS